jgi:carboxyl-terminal processing protease
MSQPSNKQQFNIYTPLLYAFILAIGMQLGYKLYESTKGKPNPMKAIIGGSSAMDEVLNYIEAQYVDTVNEAHLEDQAIMEMLNGLDPHSSYIPLEELKEVEENLQGNFDGIGVEFNILNDTITVITPINGGPSEALGIRAGDKIIEISDTLVAGVKITNEQVVGKLRGLKGTKVKVDIMRRGVKELIAYEIVRDKIPIISVDAGYMIDKETGYIKINRFSATTSDEFMQKLFALREQGMNKLILDLRQNPGGYLNAAVNIADEFIGNKDLIVYTEGRNYKRKEYNARRTGMFENEKLVVMIDEGSASASEILAGAVQDWDRGTIVGRRSFGKGLVQEQFDLSNGSALRLTIARYYTPSGRCIQKPYEEGDEEAYSEEIENRYKHGELQNADSIKLNQADTTTYRTLVKGREVFGGGGIMPDIFVPLDTTRFETFVIRARSVIPQFAYDYYGNHADEFKQYADINAFKNSYTINDLVFTQFKNTVKKELGFVDEKLMSRERTYLSNLIRAYIARQRFGSEGFYPIIQDTDDMLQRAISEIKKN